MDYITLIGSLGFPIAACCYMALRFEKILAANTAALNNLLLLITKKLR